MNYKIGPAFNKESIRLVNRTGGSLSRGDVVALNMDFASTSGQAMVGTDPSDNTDGAAGYVAGAAIVLTAANGCGILALLDQDSLADNAEGVFCIKGLVPVGCKSGVTRGDFICVYTGVLATGVSTNATRTNAGAVTGYTRAELDGFQAAIGVLGIAWETTASETTALCWFDGYAYGSIYGGGS
jgi:hypothetical protein